MDDPIEAAAMKAKMKQEKMREARKQRELQQQPGYISKSVTIGGKAMPELENEVRDDQSYDDLEDEEFDSDAMMYDSEEEAE
jgi:hypothetical protein